MVIVTNLENLVIDATVTALEYLYAKSKNSDIPQTHDRQYSSIAAHKLFTSIVFEYVVVCLTIFYSIAKRTKPRFSRDVQQKTYLSL